MNKSAQSWKKSISLMFTLALYINFLFISSGLKLFVSDDLIPDKLQDSKQVEAIRGLFFSPAATSGVQEGAAPSLDLTLRCWSPFLPNECRICAKSQFITTTNTFCLRSLTLIIFKMYFISSDFQRESWWRQELRLNSKRWVFGCVIICCGARLSRGLFESKWGKPVSRDIAQWTSDDQ